jgi:hypothetical protein
LSSLDDHLAELAHHYGRGNIPDKAIDYLGRAAQQALSRSQPSTKLSFMPARESRLSRRCQ